MHIIIPCAGEGRRFREEGFKEFKPFIHVAGKRMIEWALDPVPKNWTVWVVCRWEHQMVFRAGLGRHMRQVELLVIPRSTEGAACTVLAAAVGLWNEPVAVMNCDQWFKADLLKLHDEAMAENVDGLILTFKGEGDRWSYAKVDPLGFVTRVAEKEPISDDATVGYYWFRKGQDLVKGISSMIAGNVRVKGEYYLCPVYNELVWGYRKRVRAVQVEEFRGLGTPEDVMRFEEAMLEARR